MVRAPLRTRGLDPPAPPAEIATSLRPERFATVASCCYQIYYEQDMGHSKKREITSLVHRQVRIDERPTSLALEAEFWQYIREIAFERKVTQGQLISVINRCKRKGFSLASAIRVFVAQHYRG